MKIGLIGCGNLVNAIIRGFNSKQPKSNYQFYCYTPSQTRAKELAEAVGGIHCQSLEECKNLDVYLFGFKPQNYQEAIIDLKKVIPEGATLWSLLAGVSSERIGGDFLDNSVIRIMPNTASRVQSGITLYYHNDQVPQKAVNAFVDIFESVSNVYELESDDMIDRVTGVSASGPALVLEIGVQLASKLVEYGLDLDQAQEIVRDLFLGTGKMLQHDLDAEKLKEQITSKKGVTYEALQVLNQKNIGEILYEAIDAAYKRSVELRD